MPIKRRTLVYKGLLDVHDASLTWLSPIRGYDDLCKARKSLANLSGIDSGLYSAKSSNEIFLKERRQKGFSRFFHINLK